MQTATKTDGLTKQEVLDLGFNIEDINNATYWEYYKLMPDNRLFQDFDTTVLYQIVDNKVYVFYNNYKLELYINKNWNGYYGFGLCDSLRDVRYPNYDGRRAKAYNKKTITNILNHHTTEYTKAFIKYQQNKNAYDVTVEKLTKLGFRMHGTDRAYLTTDFFDIDVYVYENGQYTFNRIAKRYDVENDKILDLLLSLK